MGTPDNLILVLFWVVHCTMYKRMRPGRPFLGVVSGFCTYFSPIYILEGETYQMTPSSFFVLISPPFQRLVVIGGFGDASALASTEVITVPLEFYRNYSQPVLSANIFLY